MAEDLAPSPGADPTPAPTGAASGEGAVSSDSQAAAPAGNELVADVAAALGKSIDELVPDWRERVAGDDDKELLRLRRYQSWDNYAKSTKDLYNRMRSGGLKATLPENASEAEIAAFRKSWGIPQKPEDYKIELPKIDGYEVSEQDKADLGEFVNTMHSLHAPPALVKGAVNWYFDFKGKIEGQLAEAAQSQTVNNRAEIKAEYGKDYDRFMRAGNGDLVSVLGQDNAQALPALTLADGTKLGDHPLFVRYIVGSGLRLADEAMLAAPGIDHGGKSVDDQIKEIMDLRFGTEDQQREFHKPETQKRYEALWKRKTAMSQRAA